MTLTVYHVCKTLSPSPLTISTLDPESNNGQYLLRRTEFHGQTEYRTSVLVARRKADDMEIPQAKLLCGIRNPFTMLPLDLMRLFRMYEWLFGFIDLCR